MDTISLASLFKKIVYVNHELTTLYKEGEKFSKNDIIAKNDNFFAGTEQGDISYTIGKLSRVCLSPSDAVYEDSTLITNSMSSAMATKVTMKKVISLGANSNVQFIAKEGQGIKTGQPLIVFESEFDDDSISKALDKLGTDFAQEIQDLTNKVVKSKYTGEIVKVNMYYNKDMEEFSPSIQKILKPYITKNKKRSKIVNSMKPDLERDIPLDMNIDNIDKVELDKINGNDIDGLLLEFYIEYEDELSIGDKVKTCRLVL